MPRATVATTNPDSVDIEYETFGSPDDPPLLLVMGFTAQLIAWDTELCEMLAARGRYVIRFDNRDCGLSTHLDGQQVQPAAIMAASLSGEELPPVPYTLSDMAADAVGLLDHLGIARAHVMGASMGGMIAQTIAIEHPQRCLSLISVMSSPGDPRAGKPAPEALEVLLDGPAVGPRRLHRRCRAHGGVDVEALPRSPARPRPCRRRLRPGVLPGGCRPPARRHLRQWRPQRGAGGRPGPDAGDPRA